MAVPPFHAMMLPLLHLVSDGKEHSLDDCESQLAGQFKLSPEELGQLLPSGRQTVFENRLGWARTFLKKAGLLEAPVRGRIRITDRGRTVLTQEPGYIDVKFLDQFPEFSEFRKAQRKPKEKVSSNDSDEGAENTPEEALEDAYQGLRASLAQDLLNRTKGCSPRFFERLVVDLLLAMGYGGSRADAGRAVGQSGDGGIDGIIDQDRLGLDKVCIQAKRWEASVGRPIVQAFSGSLEGRGATKGVLITTSEFTKDAREYVDRIQKRIVLVDGDLLSKLMIDYGIGVASVSKYEVKKVDPDYFEEDQ
jgi:restriction system protein